jgi:hypothetical protein
MLLLQDSHWLTGRFTIPMPMVPPRERCFLAAEIHYRKQNAKKGKERWMEWVQRKAESETMMAIDRDERNVKYMNDRSRRSSDINFPTAISKY